ncbi:MAG: SLC13 family permease [Pseudomonadota bacterium]
MIVVFVLLGATVTLFVTEILRIDLSAVLVMVALGLLSQVPGLENLADPAHLFDGFASNAVISIIAVMIIGAGLDKTGLMSRVASAILKYGGSTEARIIPIISGTVGIISSFMQNVGAAALFLPVVSRISVRTGLPMSRLLMPMGFCAILGGTMTMVGSSPLILLNDLILTANDSLPADQQMETFGLFAVTPVGLALVVTGILYFVLFGRFVLPAQREGGDRASGQSIREYVRETYGFDADIFEVEFPESCGIDGTTILDLTHESHVSIIGSYHKGSRFFGPIASTELVTPCRLAVIGERRVVDKLAARYNARVLKELEVFSEEMAATNAGIAEVVIPAGSGLIGKTVREVMMRKTYGLSMLAIHRGGDTMTVLERADGVTTAFSEVPFLAGDTIVGFTKWDRLAKLTRNRNFVVVTQNFPREEMRPQKVAHALIFFAIALALVLFSDIRLSLCLLTGAVGMVVSRVFSIDEAYGAVSWSTVFLLASLIPLGQAVQATGTATWIAQEALRLLDGVPIFGLQIGVAILATAFTLIMSNVGATVLLVPLSVSIALAAGGDPAIFALTVAIATSNSFLIPTHQVNALIIGPAGYKVTDFMKSGGVMTVLFLIVSMAMMNLVF